MEYWSEGVKKDWSDGVLEWWSDGFRTQHSSTPSLQYSIVQSLHHSNGFTRLLCFFRAVNINIGAAGKSDFRR